MRRTLHTYLLVLLQSALLPCLSSAGAQVSAPTIQVGLPPALQTEVAQHVTVQPRRLEMHLGMGRTTANLVFSLFSSVNTEVTLELPDARLVNPATPGSVRLRKNSEQTVMLVATAAHNGVIRFRNARGQVIAELPYVVAPPKTVNQGASLNYSPFTGRAGLSYTVSGVPQSALDPRWSAGVSMGLNTETGKLSGGVNVTVNW